MNPQKEAMVWPTTKLDSCLETDMIPGLWTSSFSDEHCCIYRVPTRLRRVNPDAYTPQMLLIGPLHRSKIAQAFELSITDSRYLDYINMELHKKKYLKSIANKYGDQTIEEFRKIIIRDEKYIRASYSESTDWIKSPEFVEMMLLDSIFILNFFTGFAGYGDPKTTMERDILFRKSCLIPFIFEDLMLLENQLPYALLESLFEPFFLTLRTKKTFRDLTLRAFHFEGKIKKEVKFRHFTDLFRRVRVETLGLTKEQISRAKLELPRIKNMPSADKLDSAGVDLNVNEKNGVSLVIKFEAAILLMPCFIAEDNTEKVLRNLMALEQCHYPFAAYVCNYVAFLDFLIDSQQDVDLLVKKGIVINWLGHQESVAEMVNKLCLGIVDFGSHYYDIAEALNKHFDNRLKTLNRSIATSLATLQRVYFCDFWTGTATIASFVILALTLIGTVASVLQVKQNNNKSSPSPPPARGL